MKILFFQGLFSLNCMALSWLCDYSEIDGPTTTHVLYKEETSNIVKWLEKYEYCRAKGDPSVYEDAGQPKCEYSRNLCVFINDECIFNQDRENDPLNECQSLLYDNILSDELDWGRIPTESEQIESEQIESEQSEQIESEQIESEDTGTEDTGTEDIGTEDTETEDTESVDTGSEDTGSEDTETEDTESVDTGSEDTGTEETGSEDTGTEETECTETETSSTTETETSSITETETSSTTETETSSTTETETESAETESVFYSSAKLGVKSTLLLFSFPFFIV